MTDTLYEVIFQGKLAEGFSAADVRANVARLFKASPQQVEQMFSGRRVVIRNQLDQETAQKYQALLGKQGAICTIEPMADAAPAPSPQPAPAAASPAPKPAASPTAPPSNNSAAVPVERPASDTGRLNLAGKKADQILQNVQIDLAPVGALMSPQTEQPPVAAPDISHLSLAPVGATLVEHSERPPAIVPDISHLSIAPTGARLSDPATDE